MLTHNLGYPRIGSQRELKKASELYWSGKSTLKNLMQVGRMTFTHPAFPSRGEMVYLMNKAKAVIAADQLWVNPDCGLKTRHWDETKKALIEMVEAANELRTSVKEGSIA